MSVATWRKCGASDSLCKCGLIWDVKADCVVATVNKKDESGEWSDEAFQRHADLIAAAPGLSAEVARLRTALQEIRDVYGIGHLANHMRNIARSALQGEGPSSGREVGKVTDSQSQKVGSPREEMP